MSDPTPKRKVHRPPDHVVEDHERRLAERIRERLAHWKLQDGGIWDDAEGRWITTDIEPRDEAVFAALISERGVEPVPLYNRPHTFEPYKIEGGARCRVCDRHASDTIHKRVGTERERLEELASALRRRTDPDSIEAAMHLDHLRALRHAEKRGHAAVWNEKNDTWAIVDKAAGIIVAHARPESTGEREPVATHLSAIPPERLICGWCDDGPFPCPEHGEAYPDAAPDEGAPAWIIIRAAIRDFNTAELGAPDINGIAKRWAERLEQARQLAVTQEREERLQRIATRYPEAAAEARQAPTKEADDA